MRKFLLDVLGGSSILMSATATISYSKARGTKLAFALHKHCGLSPKHMGYLEATRILLFDYKETPWICTNL